ncbi:hypothetical protein K402DRAFT_179365 [Aulographum hederae CBS 113979]|uniref:Uncharacterized protein n=1 Tax=Aulographum hederae CBS 113979 TaxID=1176131 RepID=A0A6G1GR21_9PEZI|nr:hypothetical protein K402DRAFT_179365 [Aulographum hederae CBS 113979]
MPASVCGIYLSDVPSSTSAFTQQQPPSASLIRLKTTSDAPFLCLKPNTTFGLPPSPFHARILWHGISPSGVLFRCQVFHVLFFVNGEEQRRQECFVLVTTV